MTDILRRNFLKQAVGSMTVITPGVSLISIANAKGRTEPVTDKVRWGMLIDVNKCVEGCTDCVQACQNEHGWGEGSTDEQNSSARQKAQWVRIVKVRDKSTQHEVQLPMMCQHCEFPPCVDVCPTDASHKRADGIVLVDKHRCIGCRYCMMACPYKARSFIHESLHDQKAHSPRGKGTVESCNMCVHRIDYGQPPACVENCSNGAMLFGDLNNPASEISQKLKENGGTQIRADFGLNVGVRYQGI